MLWAKVDGFAEWFTATAPDLTNEELAAAIQQQYGVALSVGALDRQRRQHKLSQSPAVRARSYVVRTAKVTRPPLSGVEQQNADLKNANTALLRKIEQVKLRNAELVAAVYRAAKDAADTLQLKPVKGPVKDRRAKVPETAIAVLADWQLAKRTATYTSDVCEERIERYADKVIRLTNLQRADHPVRSLFVPMLGDLVEGELIFPGQPHLIDASLYRQVMVDGPRILGNFLRRMASHFDVVEVNGVIGNHGSLGGRARKDYHPESNADAMMYEATRMVLQDQKNVTWAPNIVSGERKWYAVHYVGKKGFLLFHGDQIKGGFAGWPWYGFAKKIQGWAMGAIPEPFHYSLSGHFHTPVRMLVGRITHWGSGSTESSNTYAAEMLAAQGTPSQWLLFAHPETGVTSEYQVHLGDGDVMSVEHGA